ncbi:MAG: BtaA family protein [Phycisphaerales bacterium]|nr:BtaA family protein [Phycisphaerales bacterium]
MLYQYTDMPLPKRDWLERMVFHGIVFNMSWEDPEMDRIALRPGANDTIISITSAGCNPLNFLCQTPKKLISVDSNPAQTAVLELKLAAIATLDYETFFDIFAARRPNIVTSVYRARLRPMISQRSREYWDRNLWMAARGLYQFGKNGLFFLIMRRFLKFLGIDLNQADDFFEIDNLEEQYAWYRKHVAPKLWGKSAKLFVYFKPFMFLAGVHPHQFDLVHERHDMFEYVKERIEYVMTRVPIYDNYFMSVAVTGKFRGKRVPPYLLEENFQTLRDNLHRVHVVNGWLGPFLDSQPAGSIDKFNLLDIFDWMWTRTQLYESTWHSIMRAASERATFIYRSGSYQLEPPTNVRDQLKPHPELARKLLARDRSATYGSFYIYTRAAAAPELNAHLRDAVPATV